MQLTYVVSLLRGVSRASFLDARSLARRHPALVGVVTLLATILNSFQRWAPNPQDSSDGQTHTHTSPESFPRRGAIIGYTHTLSRQSTACEIVPRSLFNKLQ